MGEPITNVLARLRGHRHVGKAQWEAKCPAHEDQHASLSISHGDDGRVLLHCHAGCASTDICKALGLRLGELFPPKKEGGGGAIIATYDYRDAAGELVFQVVRFVPKAFRQRRPDGHGGWLWNLGSTPRVLYRLPELMAAEADDPVLIVEGEKDADGLVKLGFVATTCPQGAGKWSKLADDSVLVGRDVVLIPDKDGPGRAHVRDVAMRLANRARSIRILELPGPGKDASDWIAEAGKDAAGQLHRLIREAKEFEAEAPAPLVPTKQSARPNILIDTEEHEVIEKTIAALTADPGIYQRGGILTRVIRDQQPDDGILRSPGSPTIQTLPPANLRERMTRCATFTKLNSKGDEVAAHPAAWLVSAVDARGEWTGIRPLMGVSDTPILRSDGSVWQTPGYDSRTGVLFEPPTGVNFSQVHPEADLDDAIAAIERLLEMVCDFRFESPDHQSAWLAGLLTPLARFAFSGPTPLFLIDANVRGAGKGLLAQTIGRIALGREMPVSSYAHEPEEMRKKITSIAIAGDRLILFDNLEGVFGNDAIDRALTSTRWKDRILGKSEEVELPLIPVWYATGNNVQVAADTARRVIHIRLDVLEEHPEDRTGFRFPNLLAWISQRRGQLLSDALTILAAYCHAGKPQQPLTPFGSFEGWSDLVRQAVVWLGFPDPCLTRTKLAESADTTADVLTQLITAWRRFDPRNHGIIVSEMLERLYRTDYRPSDEDSVAMRAALEGIVGCPPGKTPTPRQVGNKLRYMRRRVIGGTYLDIDRTYKNSATWKLFGADAARSAGESGDSGESVSALNTFNSLLPLSHA